MKFLMYILFICNFLFARHLEAEFISEDQWLEGMPWLSGVAFDNSIAYGLGIYGTSSITSLDVIDIDIHLTQDINNQSNAMVFSSTSMENELGVGIFPGSAWDVSDPDNPRRLNICFFEQSNNDLFWNPASPNGMDLEYLLIMMSDYDASGQYYSGSNILESDALYFCWLKGAHNNLWFSSEPASLELRNYWEFSDFQINIFENSALLMWEHENQTIEQEEIAYYQIVQFDSTFSSEYFLTDVNNNNYLVENLNTGQEYGFQVLGLDNYPSGEYNILMASDTLYVTANPISFNTELVGIWNNANDVLIGASTYNDIWGYTDSLGREYALVGAWDGTYIIDVSTNPSMPYEVGFIQGSYSTHRDIKTSGNYMYIGTEANRPDPYLQQETGENYTIPQGIQVVDMSNPTEAVLVNEWDGVVQSHNIMESDGYLYVIGSNQESANNGEVVSWGLDDLIILDLSIPDSPVKVGGWTGDYLHDVCVFGDTLYGTGIYTDRMYIFDIVDKSNPTLLNYWDGIPNSHACWVSDDGNTVFSASETAFGHIMSWDVSDIYNVNFLDEWYPEGAEEWSVHNIFYKNGFLIASYYAWGIQIIDVSNPENMLSAGFYDTFNSSPEGLYSGAWGAFPYFDSNYMIANDRTSGLYVVDFTVDGWADPLVLGDLNNDNLLDILDIIILVNYIVFETDLSEYQLSVSDINYDNEIDILDIMSIILVILE